MTSKRARSAIPVWVALAPFLVSCSAPQAKGRVPSSAAASPRAAPVRVEQEERAIPVDRDDPTWGSSDAAVTVVAFMDFECPFCAEAQDVVSELEATYAKGDLRFVFKHHPLPVHTGALHAAFAAQAVFEIAGVEAFREYARILFANQRSLSVANLMAWAEEVGVGRDELKAEFTSAEVRRHVLDDVRLALHIGATGTPAFRINGVPVRGVVPVSAFKDIIDAELVATAELARKGVAPDEIYARRVESNWKTPARSAAELPMPEELLDTSIWKVSVEGAPTRGPSDAPVTIVEFSEFQCPFCAMGEATLDLLLDKHPGKLRVAFRHNPMPFHEHAVLAAELALEARAQHGDAGFFEAARLLFGAQRNLDADALLVLAQKLKLDMKRTQAALARHVHRPAIEADQDLAEALQVEAVPQFFINGRRLVGAQPIGRFEQIIGERLADAEQLMAEAKVPPARLYDELMKDARAPVELERKDIGPPPASSPSRGPADAKVVLQVFSDFECPYCKRLAPVLDALSREYPRDLRVVWRHLPLPIHANAKVAAMAALEAGAQLGPDGFWRMHDLIYRFLGRPGGVPNPETLQRYAGQLGLDLVRFREAIEQGRHEAAIARDIVTALGSGITATPSVVVNGYFINGLMPLERWRRLMKRILAETSEGGRQPDPPSSVTK